MKTSPLGVERLEDRSVPATFGVPWADRHLTLSFAPDGTPVSNAGSNLFNSLNQVRSEQEWQREILRAYQAWVTHTNLTLAVAADSGQAFGTPGRWQGDERFGDVRIAGADLGSPVLALGTAADPGLAGTRAGDVVLNTAYRFDGSPYDLFSVMLHEAGHSLGMGNSSTPGSVMYTQYSGVRTGLTAADIAAVQALYGPRVADHFEGVYGNNSTGRASNLGGVPTRDTIQLAFGDLTTASDRDVYSFLTYGPGDDDQNVTVKIQSAGLSLVNARLVVYYLENGQEQEVGNATMNPDGFTGGAAAVTFDPNDDSGPRRYYVRVEKADGTTFDVGRYALGISFQDQDDDDFSQEDLLAVQGGARPVLLNADGNANNTRGTATALTPTSTSTVLPNSRYELLASLSSAADADFYRVVAPAGTDSRVLTVNTQALSGQASAPTIQLFDAAGTAISAAVLANDSGLLTVQAEGLTAGAVYFIRVNGGATGSYRLTADFGTQPTDVRTFTQGTLFCGTDREDTLYIGRAQTMQWLLSATAPGGPAGTGVRMSVLDANGNVVYSAFAEAGETVSGPGVLLRPGRYTVRVEAVGPPGYTGPVSFAVRGSKIDDPLGVVTSDPTFKPTYTDPTDPNRYRYPNGFVTTDPFYWLV